MPLAVGRNVEGTLKFYYRRAKHISETQKSIAEGFGKLLSTQMAASALEEQTQLATRMELKMLQSQINPHFLFNTIKHHRLAHSHRPRNGAQAAARIRRVLSPNA